MGIMIGYSFTWGSAQSVAVSDVIAHDVISGTLVTQKKGQLLAEIESLQDNGYEGLLK